MRAHRAALLVLLLLAAACVKQYFPPGSTDGTGGSPTAPTPPVVTAHTIEFRALGTTHEAVLQYGDAENGATEITTLVPWAASFTTTRSSLFVYVTGQAVNEGILRVQIFIDGEVFREAATDGTLGATAQASGTVEFTGTTAHDLGSHPERVPALVRR